MRIAFVSSMYGSTWGGSEELWGGAALALRKQGHDIFCGLIEWPGPAPKRDALRNAGCQLSVRKDIPNFRNRILNRFRRTQSRILDQNSVPADLLAFRPDLVVISQMFTDDGLSWMEFCHSHQLPCVTIVQAATEYQWPDDQHLPRLRNGYLKACRAYFVSQHNLRLCENQIAVKIPQAEVVWNPYANNLTEIIPWPKTIDGVYKIACVGRLQPDAKGQDILVEVLADRKWKDRPLELTFFGNGCNRQWLEDLCKMHGVKAVFGGFASIKDIWRSHHLLVHPTRKEGMPIVVIEAALCGRPVVATATAGIPEFVEDGVNGFLAPFAEATLFDATLEKAWNQRESWEALGIAAHEKIISRLTGRPEEEFAEKLITVAGASRSSPC
jgi:glycosyltransferase involved in cell wall biosynthesis